MAAPPFVLDLLGYRPKTGNPNTSDGDNPTSIAVSDHINNQLGISPKIKRNEAGGGLEEAVRHYLQDQLSPRGDQRPWVVERKRRVSDFLQYEHLAQLRKIIREDKSKVLTAQIGRPTDYLIKPDVTVGIDIADTLYLHAAVSCKWTLRSDRAQNVRHEAIMLTRHRRGRQPHIVAVTLEPLATRIASLALGTGEVDAVYHVAFDELRVATDSVGTPEQLETLEDLVNQRRLFPLSALPQTLEL